MVSRRSTSWLLMMSVMPPSPPRPLRFRRNLAFIDQCAARAQPREVLREQLLVQEIAARAAAGDMRGHDHIRHVPERAPRGQRLELVDVEAGAGETVPPQSRDPRRLVDDLAAGNVDDQR